MRRKRFIYMLTALVAFGSISAVQADSDSSTSVFIEANTDFMDNHSIAMIAKVGERLKIDLVNSEGNPIGNGNQRWRPNWWDEYKISIIGQYGKIAHFEQVNNSDYTYEWIPESGQAGIYTVVVTKENVLLGQRPSSSQILAERKIYVDDEVTNNRTKYYQISDFSITNRGAKQVTTASALSIDMKEQTTTDASLKMWWPKDDPEETISLNLREKSTGTIPQLKIEVGEELFWKKKLKEGIGQNSLSITEGALSFRFDRGTYTLWGSAKSTLSIEEEDEKKITYTRSKEGAPKIESITESGGVLIAEVEEGSTGNLEYAFIKHDDLGAVVIRDYDEDNTCPLPGVNWDYTIEVRVRRANEGKKYITLPNAYEAHDFYHVAGTVEKLQLSDVTITQSSVGEFYSSDGKWEVEAGNNIVYVNDKNYIHYKVTNAAGANIYYKAWVVDDGVYIPLESFTDNQGETWFVYYPKSGGNEHAVDSSETHKLVISAESADGRTGSKTIELTVDDIE